VLTKGIESGEESQKHPTVKRSIGANVEQVQNKKYPMKGRTKVTNLEMVKSRVPEQKLE